MSYFENESPFSREAASHIHPVRAVTPDEIDEMVKEMVGQKTAKVAGPDHVAHWHHDLNTILHFLDDQPPQIDRAKRMIEEVAEEMYRTLR